MGGAVSPHEERRTHARCEPDWTGEGHALRFRAGPRVDIRNLSASGALIETERYLGPGTALEMLLVSKDGAHPVRVRVAHSRVCRIEHGRPPRYRVGLCFAAVQAGLPSSDWVNATRQPGRKTSSAVAYPVPVGPDRQNAGPFSPVAAIPGVAHRLERPPS